MFFRGPASLVAVLFVIGFITFLLVAIMTGTSRRLRRLRNDHVGQDRGDRSSRAEGWTCVNELCRAENREHARFCGTCGAARSREGLDQ